MKKLHSFSFLVLIISLMFGALPARAQQAAPIVRQIDIQYAGPSTVSRDRILAHMRTKVGAAYAQEAVEEDVRSLYAMGMTNVRIFLGEQMRNGVKVVVVVQTKSNVGEVIITGMTQVKEKGIRKQLTVKAGEGLNEANLEADRQKILEEYRKKGFNDTKVDYKVEATGKTGSSRVVYTVNEAGKTVVGDIRFEGNQTFKSKELMKQIKTRTKGLLSFMTKSGQLQNEQIDQDTQALVDFYQNHGYLDVNIPPPDVRPTKGDRVELVFRITENRQYHTGKVSVSGPRVFTQDEVRKVVKTTEGEPFSPQKVRGDVKAIRDIYGTKGYIDLQVSPESSTGGNGIVNVNYKLDEGIQSYVERVNIQNNTHTKDKVIRREVTFLPGDVYNSVLVDKSKQRLENLNYFSRVEAFPADTGVPGHKDLNVLVEEKKTGSFNFGAGFSSIDSLLGFAEIQQSNFDITNWPNFTGGGQRFRARAQYGTQRKDFILSLTEPWFLDYQLAVGGELFYRDASYVSSVYNNRDYGFDLNVRKPLGPFTSLRFDYRIEEIGIYNVDSDASAAIKAEQQMLLKSSVTMGITHDTRDSVFLTRKGHRVDLSGYVAGGPLGGGENIYGFDLTGSQYFHLPWDMIFLLNGELASVSAYSSGDNVPIWDRLFLGGSYDLRGYSFHKAGPKDENGEPLGGKTMARMTAELTFPVIERVRGAVFYDAGVLSTSSYDVSGDLSHDVGIGARIDLPIGPVRLDYGVPLKRDNFTGPGGKFNFSIGYQF